MKIWYFINIVINLISLKNSNVLFYRLKIWQTLTSLIITGPVCTDAGRAHAHKGFVRAQISIVTKTPGKNPRRVMASPHDNGSETM